MLRRLALAFSLLWTSPAAAADEAPLHLGATGIADILANTTGGLHSGMRPLAKTDVMASFAGEAAGLPGLTLFLDVQGGSAAGFSGRLVGDAQTVSNIDGPAGLRLASFWASREFDSIGGLKAGVIDLNTEFDVQTTASLFLNSSFGIGPDFSQAGTNGPSIFPSTGLGLAGWWLPGGHWQVKAGLFEGTPGDPDHPGRTTFSFSPDEGVLALLEVRNRIAPDFVLGLGVWHHTASFDALDPAEGKHSGNSGLYAIADGGLYAPDDAESGLSGWMRLGLADQRINSIAWSASTGLVLNAPFGREADQAGLAVTHVQFTGPARRVALAAGGGLRLGETTIEATWAFNFNSHLTLQPDLQLVLSPGGATADALVAGSRIIASW